MRFSGPAPELINGRLAMVGFVAGAAAEVSSGLSLEQQALSAGPGTFLLAALIVYASLAPILKAAKSEPFGASTVYYRCKALMLTHLLPCCWHPLIFVASFINNSLKAMGLTDLFPSCWRPRRAVELRVPCLSGRVNYPLSQQLAMTNVCTDCLSFRLA